MLIFLIFINLLKGLLNALGQSLNIKYPEMYFDKPDWSDECQSCWMFPIFVTQVDTSLWYQSY